MRYLVAPRILAATLSLPLLVLVADVIGILGGYAVAVGQLGFDGPLFISNVMRFLTGGDLSSGLIKAAVFGYLIAVMGCYHGFAARAGAEGVGRATTAAVVSGAIAILASNFLLTALLFGVV